MAARRGGGLKESFRRGRRFIDLLEKGGESLSGSLIFNEYGIRYSADFARCLFLQGNGRRLFDCLFAV